ncbi:MAG: hypothetical protein M3439_13325 [Chloroflexota bacterium]|nr:hypothetical protein [Chloroflexota bacterium]
MSDEEQVQRSRIARLVLDLWGTERAASNAGVIESASQAVARIESLHPTATAHLDGAQDTDDE